MCLEVQDDHVPDGWFQRQLADVISELQCFGFSGNPGSVFAGCFFFYPLSIPCAHGLALIITVALYNPHEIEDYNVLSCHNLISFPPPPRQFMSEHVLHLHCI